MKGILQKDNEGWYISYDNNKVLPLHSSCVEEINKNYLLTEPILSKEVEFKIVAIDNNTCKYGDKVANCKVAPNCECSLGIVAKLITKGSFNEEGEAITREIEEESWESIIQEAEYEWTKSELLLWLMLNFNPPTKK